MSSLLLFCSQETSEILLYRAQIPLSVRGIGNGGPKIKYKRKGLLKIHQGLAMSDAVVKGTKLVDTAYHEAGHAVAAWWSRQLKKRDHVTIIPDLQRGSLGHLQTCHRHLSSALSRRRKGR